MRYKLKVKIFSINGIIEGSLADPGGIGILIGDQITIWTGSILLTLPLENCTRICVLPEISSPRQKRPVRQVEQTLLFATRPAT